MSIKFYMHIILLIILFGCSEITKKEDRFMQEENVKLVAPSLLNTLTFFSSSNMLNFNRSFEGTSIFISKDSREFENFINPISINEDCKYSFFSSGGGFQNSDTITALFFNTDSFANISINGSSPNVPYVNNGLRSLSDKLKASLDFKDDNWIAFSDSIINFEIEVDDKVNYESIVFSFLQNQNSWIFVPLNIIVDGKDVRGNVLWSLQKENNNAGDINDDGFEFINMDIVDVNINRIEVTITPLPSLPGWHPGKGNQPWTFIDEIILN